MRKKELRLMEHVSGGYYQKGEKVMRISSKGRYGLISMILLGQKAKEAEPTAILTISEKCGISKIYLEQVFALLKKAELVQSVKGAGGGYRLSKPSEQITVYDILHAIEAALFEKTDTSFSDDEKHLGEIMQEFVFQPLDTAIVRTLKEITLAQLIREAEQRSEQDGFMFFI